jgi:hypothetical protein
MKKKLLIILSSVVLLGISCTDKQSKIVVIATSQKTTVKQAGSSKIYNNSITVSNSQIINVKKYQRNIEATIPSNSEIAKIEVLRKKHLAFLNNSPFKKVMNLTNKERKVLGIPPNKFYEQEWELSMNPETGRPHSENLDVIRNQLINQRQQLLESGRTPGDGSDNNWVERGPNNVGGRVRAVMFDPNDPTFKTVFAGGVSGGLWKNTDITSASSTWTRVNIPENLSVSAITADPINSNIFYLGTGESYVGGDVNGDGVWKSTNGGITWAKIFGGISGSTTFQTAANLTINSPSGVAANYACYPTTAFGPPVISSITADIVSVDDGTAPSSDACETITNASALFGKIALIRRGSCTFVFKVKAAQDAGAIGVIMMNDNRPITGMADDGSGVGASITIPSIMISEQDGNIIEAAVTVGTVRGTLNPVPTGAFTGNLVPGHQHINDIKVRNNGGTSEIYVAVGDTFYGDANQTTYLGGPYFGLYKSLDGGDTWNEVILPLTARGNKHCPNDIVIANDNTIWISTTNSVVYGDGGGKIFSSSDGSNFTLRHLIQGGKRTQIALSLNNINKIYALVEDSTTGEADIYLTTNGFISVTKLSEPAAIHGTTVTDFCRGQAFYDLTISVDPTNDAIVYIGGIDIHRSSNSGSTWQTISKWSSGYTTGVSVVHADQHAMVFRPGNSNQAIFGHDGGVSFASSLSAAPTSTSAIQTRVNGLNVTQFYSVGVAPTNSVSGLTGEYFAAGAQDNGTQFFGNALAGVNASVQSQGGDGAFTMFDQGLDKYYISNYVYNENINLRPLPGSTVNAKVIDGDSNLNNGAFIAPMILDSNNDLLFSDYTSSAGVFQIRRYGNLKGTGSSTKTTFTNALLTSSPTAFAVSPYTNTTASTTLLVGTRLGKLLRLTNANLTTPTWADITGPSFVGSISDVEYGASESEIFVTMHNYNVVSIWYSSNGGTTWVSKEGNLPDLPVKCILRNPLNANEVIIGTELGVWYTNNFNTTAPIWNQSYNGMSNVKVVDLDIRNDNKVFAATYGRGIFSGQFTATSLSTDDNVLNKGIKVYPNPSNGIVNIAIDNYVGDITVEVYDINGRKVFSNAGDYMKVNTVNLQGFQKGVYILNVKGEALSYSQKIILQ